ncbi:unnamed protein product [Psylliodes chrysocephalus]|uniref:RWD domain-containing protein n=1 Tax=Psylliodes chrysocephalus TaxID=3402493 RepID=A0A9P0D2G7_9CUCU|nr:unnamed protein product [Psylliodes chrysocephala]
MTKLTQDQLQDHLQMQLTELESLQSVFYNPGEIKIEDICTLADIKDYVNNKTTVSPPYLDFTINVVVDHLKFELCVTLPHEYPKTEPEIFVRNHKLNRNKAVQLNKDLNEFITNQEKGEPCIFSAVSWLQDNSSEYVQVEQEETPPKNNTADEKYLRYWIYSHHIYSKTKRREIVELAHQLKITGFCMPGKPGIICVEGTTTDVIEWWQTIKSMNWKKIFCKVVEEDQLEEGRAFLKFEKFEEVVFQNSGVKFNHMDMGELFRFLEERSLGYIFKDLFGVDAKSSHS